MNMREIEIICELLNYKSFYDAAYGLSFSPSVITKYVSNVEEELGVKLFIRSRKSNDLRLTPEGRVLISALRRINNDYNYLMELTKQIKSDGGSVIRIGALPRYGNIHEQEIIASFLQRNPDAETHMVKMVARDLMNLLMAGKLDAMFAVLIGEIKIDEYFKEEIAGSDLDITYIASEKSMYLGISEKYLPGKTEAAFREFRDFTFAFPFPNSPDIHEKKAVNMYERLASENGFKLRSMNVAGQDNSVFRLAAMSPIAVCTTNIPAQYSGIKFVRISDWPGCTHLYFIYRKSNRSELLRSLRRCVALHLEQYPAEAE